jgi:hypothetical protein
MYPAPTHNVSPYFSFFTTEAAKAQAAAEAAEALAKDRAALAAAQAAWTKVGRVISSLMQYQNCCSVLRFPVLCCAGVNKPITIAPAS